MSLRMAEDAVGEVGAQDAGIDEPVLEPLTGLACGALPANHLVDQDLAPISHQPNLTPRRLLLGRQQLIGVEARVVAGVARRTLLIHLEQHGVAVTVKPHRVDVLGVPGRLALDPVIATRP